jgi:hypothetical protein
MADSDAVNQAQAGVANLQLDEVTGERVSKSELKKRIKQRDVEKKKAEKAAAAKANAPEKKKSAEEEEKELTPNVRPIQSGLRLVFFFPRWYAYTNTDRLLLDTNSNISKSEAQK